LPPLAGPPYAKVKNLFDIEGLTTRAGEGAPTHKLPPARMPCWCSARVPARWCWSARQHGRVFAHGFTTENSRLRRSPQPAWTRTAGGLRPAVAAASRPGWHTLLVRHQRLDPRALIVIVRRKRPEADLLPEPALRSFLSPVLLASIDHLGFRPALPKTWPPATTRCRAPTRSTLAATPPPRPAPTLLSRLQRGADGLRIGARSVYTSEEHAGLKACQI
jgi:hypothetical protein